MEGAQCTLHVLYMYSSTVASVGAIHHASIGG